MTHILVYREVQVSSPLRVTYGELTRTRKLYTNVKNVTAVFSTGKHLLDMRWYTKKRDHFCAGLAEEDSLSPTISQVLLSLFISSAAFC